MFSFGRLYYPKTVYNKWIQPPQEKILDVIENCEAEEHCSIDIIRHALFIVCPISCLVSLASGCYLQLN